MYNKRTQSMSILSYYLVIVTSGKTPCLSDKHSLVLKRHFEKVAKSFGIHLLTWDYHDYYLEISFSVDKGNASVVDFIMVFKSTSSYNIKRYYPELVVDELKDTSFWNQGYFLKTLGMMESMHDLTNWLENLK